MPDGIDIKYGNDGGDATGKLLISVAREQDGASAALTATNEFLNLTLPSAGLKCVAWVTTKGTFVHEFVETVDDAARVALEWDGAGRTVYYAMAGFSEQALGTDKDTNGRKQINVVALKSFWLDIDCGPEKEFPDQVAGNAAFDAFVVKSSLSDYNIVLSGNGLHVYWVLTEDVAPADWQRVANKLKALCAGLGFKVDTKPTANSACVLRPVGTTHRKDPANPKLVMLVRRAAQDWTLAEFEAQVDAAIDFHKIEVRQPCPASKALNSEFWTGGETDYPPTYFHKIARGCRAIRWMMENPNEVSEGLWYAGLQVTRICEEGREASLQLSAGYDGFDEAEMDKKLHQLTRGKIAPSRCDMIEGNKPGICDGCPHKGKIRTPATLGIEVPVVTAEAVAQAMARLPQHGVLALKAVNDEAPGIAVLNRKYAFVGDWGKQAGYIRYAPDGEIVWTTADEIRAAEDNKRLRVKDGEGFKLKPAGSHWLTHYERAEYERVIYDPEGIEARPGERVLNPWQGLNRQGHRGWWSKMRRHLFDVICKRDWAAFWYLLCWFAHLVQHPGTAPGTVVVLKSAAEGTGKTTVGQWFHDIFGRAHSLLLNSPDQILGQFNAHLEAKSLLVVNKPSFPGDHAKANRLKSIITESELLIHPKFRRPYLIRNTLHIILTTNEAWAVPAGNMARRFLVLEVDNKFASNTAYFDALYAEADNGGLEAMLGFLQRLDISAWKPQQIPVTDALIAEQERSLPIEAEWALAMGADLLGGWFGDTATTSDLYEKLVEYAKNVGRRPPSAVAFGRWLKSIGLQPARIGPKKMHGWALPTQNEFHTLVRKAAGIHQRAGE